MTECHTAATKQTSFQFLLLIWRNISLWLEFYYETWLEGQR